MIGVGVRNVKKGFQRRFGRVDLVGFGIFSKNNHTLMFWEGFTGGSKMLVRVVGVFCMGWLGLKPSKMREYTQ